MTQRSGIAGHRRRAQINGAFLPLLIEMLESPAWRVLSLAARRVLDRVAIEVRNQGGHQAAGLCVTYEDFNKYGIERHCIAPAIREAVALGFLRITQQGRAGNAEFRRPQLYQLTFAHARDTDVSHSGWQRIVTMAEAKAKAKQARASKPPSKIRKPVRQNTPTSVRDSRTENRRLPVRNSPTLGSGKNHTTIYISEGGRSGGRLAAASPSTTATPSTHASATARPRSRTTTLETIDNTTETRTATRNSRHRRDERIPR